MTVTAPTPATALPTPPSTSDPTNFNTRGDAFLGALADPFVDEMNALASVTYSNASAAETAATTAEAAAATASAASLAAVASTDYAATSSSSVAVGTGSKSLTLAQTGKAFAVNDAVVLIRRSNPAIRMFGTISAFTSGTGAMTVSVTTALGSGTYTDWSVVLQALAPDTSVGRQALWIPAGAMYARNTNGAAVGVTETTTNKIVQQTLDFDASTQEFAQFMIRMPKAWDEGTVTFQPVWSHASTTTNFGVVWQLQAVAISNDDALDAAFGTAQTSTDTGGTTDDVYVGPESSAITVAGTPQAEDLVVFQIARVPANGSDTMAVDARLLGITLFINVASENDI